MKKKYICPLANIININVTDNLCTGILQTSPFREDDEERGHAGDQVKEHLGSWENIWGEE